MTAFEEVFGGSGFDWSELSEAERDGIRRARGRMTKELVDSALHLGSKHAGRVASKVGKSVVKSDEDIVDETIGKTMKIDWYYYQSCLRVCVTQKRHAEDYLPDFTGPKLAKGMVIGQNRRKYYPSDARERAAKLYDNMLMNALPGLEVSKTLRFCDGPCEREAGVTGGQCYERGMVTWSTISPALCIQIGNEWLCSKCQKALMLGPAEPDPDETKTHAERERAKMSRSLRFDVLRRDNFTCQACGSEAPDVDLEVDHIKPVSKGGETEMENLQALCADCNRGKSDKRVTQMEVV